MGCAANFALGVGAYEQTKFVNIAIEFFPFRQPTTFSFCPIFPDAFLSPSFPLLRKPGCLKISAGHAVASLAARRRVTLPVTGAVAALLGGRRGLDEALGVADGAAIVTDYCV